MSVPGQSVHDSIGIMRFSDEGINSIKLFSSTANKKPGLVCELPVNSVTTATNIPSSNKIEFHKNIVTNEISCIKGEFDGNFENTYMSMGGKEVQYRGESQQGIYFTPPKNIFGSQMVNLKDGNNEYIFKQRIYNLDAFTDRNNYLKHDKGKLYIYLNPVSDLTEGEFVPVELNENTGTISLNSGNNQIPKLSD